MISKNLSVQIDGINYTFESAEVRRMVDPYKISEVVKKNSYKFSNYFSIHHFTFHFRNFAVSGEDLNDVFFSVDKEKRTINFNALILSTCGLLEHYVSFAIIHTCDSFFLAKSFADHSTFKIAMIESFEKFINVTSGTVDKMCNAFLMFNCYDDTLPIRFAYEYASPYKFLYEAYALICDGNEEIKTECSDLYEILYTLYFKN